MRLLVDLQGRIFLRTWRELPRYQEVNQDREWNQECQGEHDLLPLALLCPLKQILPNEPDLNYARQGHAENRSAHHNRGQSCRKS